MTAGFVVLPININTFCILCVSILTPLSTAIGHFESGQPCLRPHHTYRIHFCRSCFTHNVCVLTNISFSFRHISNLLFLFISYLCTYLPADLVDLLFEGGKVSKDIVLDLPVTILHPLAITQHLRPIFSILRHLRMSLRNRSVFPVGHRFPIPAPCPPH